MSWRSLKAGRVAVAGTKCRQATGRYVKTVIPPAAIQCLIELTQDGGGINTAYIEQLNATFRARLHRLVRHGRNLGRQIPTLQQGMYLVGVINNFCTFHDTLILPKIRHIAS